MDLNATSEFSSITLTKNEEDHIGECLKSIQWCDEHIVIDEYSEDSTVEIAESLGANVIQIETPESANTFDILRENAVEAASNEWIVRIDADERSHTQLNTTLQILADSEYPDIVKIPRMNFVGDKWFTAGSRWWPDYSPMLFHREHMDFEDRIHTFMSPKESANTVLLPAEEKYALRHYSYESVSDLAQRRWRYAKIEGEMKHYSAKHLLYSTVSDFVESYVVDRGWTKGSLGLEIAMIDSLYNIATALYD